ncbi:hypothetical protein C4553_01450 [Candidatus Parcubacteria bacterium]|nr:MAG: hypothetical protein C4553_01450 [Candidatus Parcubacteria bacterium]
MKSFSITFILSLLVLVLGWFIFWNFRTPKSALPDFSGWNTYVSEKFGFEIQYPPDWEVQEFDNSPYIYGVNFYKPSPNLIFPLTHHSDVTHVSVFPQGIPTEGVFGKFKESARQYPIQAKNKIDFLLEDQSVWGMMSANFTQKPASWDDFGFVWSGLKVENLRVKCFREGKEVDAAGCDPLMGDEVVRTGVVSEEDREIEEQMLSTLRLINP